MATPNLASQDPYNGEFVAGCRRRNTMELRAADGFLEVRKNDAPGAPTLDYTRRDGAKGISRRRLSRSRLLARAMSEWSSWPGERTDHRERSSWRDSQPPPRAVRYMGHFSSILRSCAPSCNRGRNFSNIFSVDTRCARAAMHSAATTDPDGWRIGTAKAHTPISIS